MTLTTVDIAAVNGLSTALAAKADKQNGNFTGDFLVSDSGTAKIEASSTSANAAFFRLRNTTGFFDILHNSSGEFAVSQFNAAGTNLRVPLRFTNAGLIRLVTTNLSVESTNNVRVDVKTTATATGQTAILNLDPSGTGVRGASLIAANPSAATATELQFWTANGSDPVKQATLAAGGVMDFRLRPTFNGVGLATTAEAAGGGGGAGVTSFNGRTGIVTPAANDYSSTQIPYLSGTVSSYLAKAFQRLAYYCPEEFGAVGDGNTDDSNAFDAMMAAIPDNGPSLITLSKRYYLSRQWQINKNGCRVIGQGAMSYISGLGTAIIFKNNNFDGIMIGTNVDGNFVYGVELSHFQVLMQTCTDQTRFAIVVAGAAQVRLLRIRALGSGNLSANQCNGIWFRDGQSLSLDQCYFLDFTADYVFLQSAALQINNPGGDQRWIYGGRRPDVVVANASRFAGQSGTTRTQAVRIAGAAVGLGSSMFRDCTTIDCKNHYVMEKESGSTTTGIPSFLYIMGKGGEAASDDYIRLVHGYHFMINGSYFGTADDSGSGGSGLVVEATFGGPVIATGNYIKSTAKHVVHIKGGRDITLSGNTFGRAGVGSSQVYSNVRIESAASEVILNGNNFTNLVPATSEPYSSTRYGIDCTSDDYMLITGNRARGGLGDIRYKAGTNVTVANNLGGLISF